MSADVYVVIPYFQREAGILRRALASVAAQTGVEGIHVVIVNDASPIPPGPEIESSGLARGAVHVIEEANSGPGAARNRGLDHVPPEAGFIAFLDSDDAWTSHHLRNALDALGEDLDLYFSNYLEPDSIQDQFTRHGRITLAAHTPRARGNHCYRFDLNMTHQVIMGNVIETSTVVYRWSTLNTLRFDPSLRNAFEDHVFWIRSHELGRGFAFSNEVECRYGRGVNIWRSSFHAGSALVIPKVIDQRRYLVYLLRCHAELPEHRARIKRQLKSTRRAIVEHIAHSLRRRQKINWNGVGTYARLDPGFVPMFLPLMIQISITRRAKRAGLAGVS
jgi:succinoglycan biosynthesis protein ExoW